MAPPGQTSLYVLVPVPNLKAGIDWKGLRASYRQLVLDRLFGFTRFARPARSKAHSRLVTPLKEA